MARAPLEKPILRRAGLHNLSFGVGEASAPKHKRKVVAAVDKPDEPGITRQRKNARMIPVYLYNPTGGVYSRLIHLQNSGWNLAACIAVAKY